MSYARIAALLRLAGAAPARHFARLSFPPAACLAQLAARRALPTPGTHAMGLAFTSPLGLAAGFDRTGRLIRAAAALGFGSIELGTAAPRAEPGKPAIKAVLEFLGGAARTSASRIRVGINIGANSATRARDTVDDYLACLRAAWGRADYLVLNLSARSTASLRDPVSLVPFLTRLAEEGRRLAGESGHRTPVAIKLPAPSPVESNQVLHLAVALDFDALILVHPPGAQAAPAIERVVAATANRLAIVSVGGIATAREAQLRLEAGAALIQMFTSVVEQGPFIARNINRHLEACRSSSGPRVAGGPPFGDPAPSPSGATGWTPGQR